MSSKSLTDLELECHAHDLKLKEIQEEIVALKMEYIREKKKARDTEFQLLLAQKSKL